MKNDALLAAALSIAGLGGAAHAATVNFDDIAVNRYDWKRLNTYADMSWDNMGVGNNMGYGYNSGTVSQANTAFNIGGRTATFSSGTPFTFNSAYFTGAFSAGTYIAIGQGAQRYEMTFDVLNTAPTLVTFNWTGLYSVSIGWISGNSNGRQFVMDDLKINDAIEGAVPEPSTWAMMMLGFGLVGTAMRRRTTISARFA